MSMSLLTAVVVVADEQLREEITETSKPPVVRVVNERKSLEDVEDLLDAIERYRADAVLIEGRLLNGPLGAFVQRLKLTASEPVVFLLQREAVAEQILEAMQAGAREYLCPPLATPLREAYERLATVRAEQVTERQNKLGKLYGFMAAKGGCGASTFACHTAWWAAKQATHTVLLADMDFEAGIQRFILKAKPNYTVRDAVDNMHRMDSNFWNAVVHPVADRLEFLAAPEELADRETPEARHVARLLRFIRTTYRTAILDLGRWRSAAALDSLPEMEALYIMTLPDSSAYDGARDFLKAAEERGHSTHKVQILLNGAPAKQKNDLAALEKATGLKAAGVFSDDRDALYETWSEGRLLSDESVLGQQLMAHSQKVLGMESSPAGAKSNGIHGALGAFSGISRLLAFGRGARN